MKRYVIGVDFGTNTCRTLVTDADTGAEAAVASAGYPRWSEGRYCDPATNRYRQHPADYIEALTASVLEAVTALPGEEAYKILGIGIDTTGSTPALTGRDGMPLALDERFADDPDAMFILWKDHTSIAEAEEITALAHKWDTDFTSHSGGVYSSEWAWAKVLRVLRTNEKVARAAYSWAEHCDWMTGLLTGNTRPETMPRNRCAAGHKAMWNAAWNGLPSREFLSRLDPRLGETRDRYSSVTVTAGTRVGSLTPEWAGRLGLPADIAVAAGLLDAHMGAIGACAGANILTRVIGTSTCDIITVGHDDIGDRCIPGICGQVDGSVIPGYVGIEAGQSAFGDIFAWWRDTLLWPLTQSPDPGTAEAVRDRLLSDLTAADSELAPGEGECLAVDWLNGRRTPYADQNLKGVLSGLTLGTTAPMIFRALAESTAYGSRAITDHLREHGVAIEAIHATGGIAHRSPLVMQILSDVLDMPIKVVASGQTCALGAAMSAAVAAGIHPGFAEAQAAMGSGFTAEYTPLERNVAVYKQLYDKYLQLGRFTAYNLYENQNHHKY